jgi:hypothetical protein
MVNEILEIAPMSQAEILEMSRFLSREPKRDKDYPFKSKLEKKPWLNKFNPKEHKKINSLNPKIGYPPKGTPARAPVRLPVQPTLAQLQAAKYLGYTPEQLRQALAVKGPKKQTVVTVRGTIVMLPQTLEGLAQKVTQASAKRRQQVTTAVEAAVKLRRQRKQKMLKPIKELKYKSKSKELKPLKPFRRK